MLLPQRIVVLFVVFFSFTHSFSFLQPRNNIITLFLCSKKVFQTKSSVRTSITSGGSWLKMASFGFGSEDEQTGVILRKFESQFEIDEVDLIIRVAFGTFQGLERPAEVFGDKRLTRHLHHEYWVAFLDGEVAGSIFTPQWGTVGVIGPLTVRPDLWDKGIGQMLLEKALEYYDAMEDDKLHAVVLSTYPSSPKHLAMYWKHGFQPRLLIAYMNKNVDQQTILETGGCDYQLQKFSINPKEQGLILEELAHFTSLVVHEGMNLESEIRMVEDLNLGDTFILRNQESSIRAYAVCHWGPGTEGGSGILYLRFVAASSEESFIHLLQSCEKQAGIKGLHNVQGGVNLGRVRAFQAMLGLNYTVKSTHLAMERKVNTRFRSWDQESDFVCDEWW